MSRAIENASSWRAKHQIPKGVCTWCRGPVPKGSRHWCADKACTTEFLIRRDPTFARARVADRDNGVCRSCGIDTERIRAELTALRKLVSATYAASAEEREHGGGAAAATRWRAHRAPSPSCGQSPPIHRPRFRRAVSGSFRAACPRSSAQKPVFIVAALCVVTVVENGEQHGADQRQGEAKVSGHSSCLPVPWHGQPDI